MRGKASTKAPRRRKPRIAARAKVRAQAGSQAALVFSERLQLLIRERCDGSRYAFAQLLTSEGHGQRVGTSHISKWCDHGILPGSEKLEWIATRTGVSVDWLLGLPDAPMYRDQTRTSAELALDLAAHLVRELTERFPLAQGLRWGVNHNHILEHTVESLNGAVKSAIAFGRAAQRAKRLSHVADTVNADTESLTMALQESETAREEYFALLDDVTDAIEPIAYWIPIRAVPPDLSGYSVAVDAVKRGLRGE